MKIIDIYQRYTIPKNLQSHMLRVAAIGKIIVDNWNGPVIDKQVLINTLLLHDMGNIIKFNFGKIQLLDPADMPNVDKFRLKQWEFIEKYGPDCDEATLKIIEELQLQKQTKIIDLCANSHGDHLDVFIKGDNWDRKIAYYADMRIGPFGLMSVPDRFADLINRYPEETEDLNRYMQQCLKIEAQLQRYVLIELNEIDEDEINTIIDKLVVMDIN